MEIKWTYMNEYQVEAIKTAIYPKEQGMIYTALGLCGEAGEVAEKIKKYIRDGGNINLLQNDIKKELGDVLWYVANLANEFDLSLDSIAKKNLEKLNSRKERNVLSGSGDNR